MLAEAGRIGNHKIGFGDLPQGVALVALLPAAHLARTAAQASGQARQQYLVIGIDATSSHRGGKSSNSYMSPTRCCFM